MVIRPMRQTHSQYTTLEAKSEDGARYLHKLNSVLCGPSLVLWAQYYILIMAYESDSRYFNVLFWRDHW